MAKNADVITLEFIEKEKAGARARSKRIARRGLPELPANAEVRERKKEMAQYRAGIALLWDRNRILQETGWSLQRFLAVERFVRDEDKRLTERLDPRAIWTEYRLQQLQAARELEDLAEIFREGRQFNALVSAVKARSDILDRVIKTGQELGVVKRAAREINVTGQVDYKSMSVQELRVHLRQEMTEVHEILTPGNASAGVAGKVLENILKKGKREDPAKKPAPTLGRRVKRLKPRTRAPETGENGSE